MKINEVGGVGKIVKGVNTTPDVQPGETERQAKKFFGGTGKPQSLMSKKTLKNSTPNKLFNLGLTEDELTTIQSAEMFAQQAHKDHKRKYTGDPYYVHLDEVRRIVKGAGGSEDMQAAALLHDTVEDTSVTSQDILKEFGPRIAKLVVELTDVSKPEDGNRAVRKGIDRDKLAGVSAEAQTIKYADLISNGKDIAQNDPKFAKVYMKEKADLLKVMTKGDSRLRSAALAMLPDELKENMSVTGTERRRLEKKKGLEIGSPEWFKHWFDLPYLREDTGIQKVDIQQLEKFADRLFGKVGIDVEFTRHFMDRVNDIRNKKPITMSELTRLFKQEYKRWGKPIAQMGPNSQAVMKDLQTDINLPFVLKWDDKNMELDLIAKTVMRKADFKTPNKEFPVESQLNEVRGQALIAIIDQISEELGISREEARAIAYQESRLRHSNKDGSTLLGDLKLKNKAYGAFQVRLPALQDVNRLYKTNYTMDDLNDPMINARVGLLYYKSMTDFYGAKNKRQAMAGYNGGPGAIKGNNEKANSYADSVLTTIDSDNPQTTPRIYDNPKNPNPQTTTSQPTLRPKTRPEPAPPLKAPGTFDFDQPMDLPDTGYRTQPFPLKPPIPNPSPTTLQPTLRPEPTSRPKTRPADIKPVFQPVTYQDLAGASGIADPNKIFPGQNINLPDGTTYTIKSGDSLSRIAKDYNTRKQMGENVPTTNKPGTIGQHINWAGKNKIKQQAKYASGQRSTQDPQSWWQSMLQKGKNLFDDEQLDLKKKV